MSVCARWPTPPLRSEGARDFATLVDAELDKATLFFLSRQGALADELLGLRALPARNVLLHYITLHYITLHADELLGLRALPARN